MAFPFNRFSFRAYHHGWRRERSPTSHRGCCKTGVANHQQCHADWRQEEISVHAGNTKGKLCLVKGSGFNNSKTIQANLLFLSLDSAQSIQRLQNPLTFLAWRLWNSVSSMVANRQRCQTSLEEKTRQCTSPLKRASHRSTQKQPQMPSAFKNGPYQGKISQLLEENQVSAVHTLLLSNGDKSNVFSDGSLLLLKLEQVISKR